MSPYWENFLFNIIYFLFALNALLLVGNVGLRLCRVGRRKAKTRHDKIHLLSIIGSGGHTTEMMKLLGGTGEHYAQRTYVVANTDKMGEQKVLEFEKMKSTGSYSIHFIPRSREVGQSYVSAVWTTLVALWFSASLVWKMRPDIILSNGPGTALPICAIGKAMDMLRLAPIRVVYVESICRVRTLSLTGLLLYHTRLAHSVVVQWPELKIPYPRVKYIGRLV